MQAVWYNKFGSAENVLEIGEYQTPEPVLGESLGYEKKAWCKSPTFG